MDSIEIFKITWGNASAKVLRRAKYEDVVKILKSRELGNARGGGHVPFYSCLLRTAAAMFSHENT